MDKRLLLEQAIYSASSRNLEDISGLGFTAATRTDADCLSSIGSAVNVLSFPTTKTEFSFFYNRTFGFGTAATSTRREAVGDSRPSPYIHFVFSGRHPADPAVSYGFRAPFRSAPSGESGELPLLPCDPLPDTNPLAPLSVNQLAWLMEQLWALQLPGERTRPLLFSAWPSVWTPEETDASLPFLHMMCALADLIPVSMRLTIAGTTAEPSELPLSNTFFNVRFTRNSELSRALSPENMPSLLPPPDDFFGALCLRMAETYRTDRQAFYRLTDKIEREVLRTLKQPTLIRVAVASCCAMLSEPLCPWAPSGGEIDALIQSAEQELHADKPFWNARLALLKSQKYAPNLRNLLVQFQDSGYDDARKCKELSDYYHNMPEKRAAFARDFFHALGTNENRHLAVSVWLWRTEEREELMSALFPFEAQSIPDDFYACLETHLDFWTPRFPNPIAPEKAPRQYFSVRLRNGPAASLRHLESLIRYLQKDKPCCLLDADPVVEKALDWLNGLDTLPDADFWRDAALWMSRRPELAPALERLWRAQPVSSEAELSAWRNMGQFLRISDYQARYDALIDGLLKEAQRPEDVLRLLQRHRQTFRQEPYYADAVERIETLAGWTTPFAEEAGSQSYRFLHDALDILSEASHTISDSGNDFPILQRKLRLRQSAEKMRAMDLFGLTARSTVTSLRTYAPDEDREVLHRLWFRLLSDAMERWDSVREEPPLRICDAVEYCAALPDFGASVARQLCQYYCVLHYSGLRDFYRKEQCKNPLLIEAGKERLFALESTLSFFELYDFTKRGLDAPLLHELGVPCPAGAWENLTMAERVQVLHMADTQNPKGREALLKMYCPDIPFSGLVCAVLSPRTRGATDRELDELFDCIAGVAGNQGQTEELFKLMSMWREIAREPDTERFFQKLRETEPPLTDLQRNRVLQTLYQVFPHVQKESAEENGPKAKSRIMARLRAFFARPAKRTAFPLRSLVALSVAVVCVLLLCRSVSIRGPICLYDAALGLLLALCLLRGGRGRKKPEPDAEEGEENGRK